MAAVRRVKLARLSQLDRRTHVGTPAWRAAHPRSKGVIAYGARKLSAWRRLHALAEHSVVRNAFPKHGPSPTKIPAEKMANLAKALE